MKTHWTPRSPALTTKVQMLSWPNEKKCVSYWHFHFCMYGINRLQCGRPSDVFVISLIWFKSNAAMNLRASCSWPPAVMFLVTFIESTERSDLPWTVIKLWFILRLTCIQKIVKTLILCICTLHRLTVRLHFYRQKKSVQWLFLCQYRIKATEDWTWCTFSDITKIH